MREVGHVARRNEQRNAYEILLEKSEKNDRLGDIDLDRIILKQILEK
jgi:hypothetical protein